MMFRQTILLVRCALYRLRGQSQECISAGFVGIVPLIRLQLVLYIDISQRLLHPTLRRRAR